MSRITFEIPEDVRIDRAGTPHRFRFARHDFEPKHGDRQLEVVLLERGEPDYPGERIVITNAADHSSYPYSEQWGESLTTDQALRLAAMLQAAAYTIIDEQDDR